LRRFPAGTNRILATVELARRSAGQFSSLQNLVALRMMTMRRQILLVEDDPALREIEYQILRKMEFEVVTLECAEKAIRLLDECSFDLLMTDIHLGGGLNGIDLMRVARDQAFRLKILAVSGGMHERRTRSVEALADGLLDKPFSIGELRANVLHVLEPAPRIAA
jgi:DNA-binding response OmpR family regulator